MSTVQDAATKPNWVSLFWGIAFLAMSAGQVNRLVYGYSAKILGGVAFLLCLFIANAMFQQKPWRYAVASSVFFLIGGYGIVVDREADWTLLALLIGGGFLFVHWKWNERFSGSEAKGRTRRR